MTPTPLAAYVLGAIALSALVLPPAIVVLAGLAVVATAVVDAWTVRRAPLVERRIAQVLSRGVEASFECEPVDANRRVRIRQSSPPDIEVRPPESDDMIRGRVVARRRGKHLLPAPALWSLGPLGLGSWYHRAGGGTEVLVYPDLPAARTLALAVRTGRFREPGRMTRGPLGLGTEFESIRDYLPDDDIRQVNWRATARLGRAMSNQYRVEQDRDVLCVVDSGRLMAAPLGDRTRLDAALDAVTAVALVADEVGDRCGAVAFDSEIRRNLRPRRAGGDAVVRTLFDVEVNPVDSDYELAFRRASESKRALVIVFTDLLEESAARPLIEAVPLLARKHAVVVASATDVDLVELVTSPPLRALDVYRASVALELLDARARVASQLRSQGANVIEAPGPSLGAACVAAYLRAKSRARL